MESTLDTRQRLAREDDNFKRLERKHQAYESQLEELSARRYLSDEERVEQVRLKKLKLAIKDQMESLVRQASGA